MATLYRDDVCEVMRLGSLAINVLKSGNAQELAAQGVSLINGPVDRPWGRRTAAFADPDGNVRDIAQDI